MPNNPILRAIENRNNFPPGELQKYENQWVAWAQDCTRIVAAAADLASLEAAVKAAGMRISETEVELILPPDDAFMGEIG